MADDSLREKLDGLNEAITDRLISRIGGEDTDGDGNPVPASNDDIRLALQLLKQNSISAAAVPENPADRMHKMLAGMRLSPGHLEARQKALPHLLPGAIPVDATHSTTTADIAER
jgi:hypothetical protein